MSQWMSIGFDPDQMDPATAATETDLRAAISGARDGASPRWTSGVGQTTPGDLGVVGALNGPRKHWMAGAIRHIVARGH